MLLFLWALLFSATLATAGTVTGTIALPNTALPLANGTLTFTLSQVAYVSGSFLAAPLPISCYTSSGGQVVGLPDPLVLPVVTPDTLSGTLPNGTYFVELTYANASGETLVSPEQTVTLVGAGKLTINAPVLQPSNAVSWKVYIGSSSGTETLQATVTGFGGGSATYVQSVPLAAGAAVPSSNTSVCSLRFNDELIPTGTWYSTTLNTRAGLTIPGFPQRWFFYGGSGATINLSNGYPTSPSVTVFPTPLWASPQGGIAMQSVASGLNLGSNPFLAGLGTFTSLTVTSGGASVVGGIANNSGGITATGTMTGATLNGASSGNAVTLLNNQSNSGAITGTNAAANVFSYTLPGNTLQAGKGIRITVGWTHTGGSSVAYGFNFGSLNIPNVVTGTGGNGSATIVVMNKPGSTNAQTLSAIGTAGAVAQSNASSAGAVDTTAGVSITFTFNVANTDSVTPVQFSAEVIQ